MLNLFLSNPNSEESKLYFARMNARYNRDDVPPTVNTSNEEAWSSSPTEQNLGASALVLVHSDKENDIQEVETAAEEEQHNMIN